ncbi:MAG: MerR family DNA-binding protein [Betaproteobacteria bacterium]|nr:MerR family DNA-binding protein [Betaproteobacteria bacterium]
MKELATPRATLTTSAIMKRSGLGRNALRFYEERGLLESAQRTAAGYRLYTPAVLLDLQFIKQAKAAGLSLAEIKDLLAIGRDEVSTCGAVAKTIAAKVTDIEALIAQLERRKAFLQEFLGTCKSNNAAARCEVRTRGFQPSACCAPSSTGGAAKAN